MAIRIEIKSESGCCREPAGVKIYNNNQLITEVIAVVEPKEGADGGYYDCVTLRRKDYPVILSRIYFGHPVNTYNTDLEQFLLKKITESFLGSIIENPNQEDHAGGYARYKKEYGNGMQYFYEKVLPYCNGGIFLPFRSGSWGAGTFQEARKLAERNAPIWQISPEGLIAPVYNFTWWNILNVAETTDMIRDADGNPKPY